MKNMSVRKFKNYLNKVNKEFKNCKFEYSESDGKLLYDICEKFQNSIDLGANIFNNTEEILSLLSVDGTLFLRYPNIPQIIIQSELFELFEQTDQIRYQSTEGQYLVKISEDQTLQISIDRALTMCSVEYITKDGCCLWGKKTFSNSKSPKLNFTISRVREIIKEISRHVLNYLITTLPKDIDEDADLILTDRLICTDLYQSNTTIKSIGLISENIDVVIEDCAFKNCTELSEVRGLDRVTRLGVDIFKNCTSLPKLDIGEELLTKAIASFDEEWSLQTLLNSSANEYMLVHNKPVCLELELPNITEETYASYAKSLKKRRFLYYLRSHIND